MPAEGRGRQSSKSKEAAGAGKGIRGQRKGPEEAGVAQNQEAQQSQVAVAGRVDGNKTLIELTLKMDVGTFYALKSQAHLKLMCARIGIDVLDSVDQFGIEILAAIDQSKIFPAPPKETKSTKGSKKSQASGSRTRKKV